MTPATFAFIDPEILESTENPPADHSITGRVRTGSCQVLKIGVSRVKFPTSIHPTPTLLDPLTMPMMAPAPSLPGITIAYHLIQRLVIISCCLYLGSD